MRTKVETLKKGIAKLEKENAKLGVETQNNKRTSTILGLQSEMERQDMVIELVRSHLKNESLFDSSLSTELDKGPKRIRPPTREELYIELGGHKDIMKGLEDDWIKLVPAADPTKYKVIETQTDPDWLESSQISDNLNDIEKDRSTKEQVANRRLTELKRLLKIQKSTVDKIKLLIETKGSNSQKIANIKEDLQDLKLDVEMKTDKLEKIRAHNEETRQKLQSLSTTKNSTVTALQNQVMAAEHKLKQLQKENDSFDAESAFMLKAIRDITADSEADRVSDQIAAKRQRWKEVDVEIEGIKVRYSDRLAEIEAVENLIQKLNEDIGNVNNDIKDDRERIENEHEVQATEENDLEWGIKELKQKVSKARLREIELLEEVETLESDISLKKAKSASLNLLSLKDNDYLQQEDQIEVFRLRYETDLNDKILENTALKRKVQEAEDLLYLMQQHPEESLSRVDSKIESVQTFEVLQPEDRPEFNQSISMTSSISINGSKILKKYDMKKKPLPSTALRPK